MLYSRPTQIVAPMLADQHPRSLRIAQHQMLHTPLPYAALCNALRMRRRRLQLASQFDALALQIHKYGVQLVRRASLDLFTATRRQTKRRHWHLGRLGQAGGQQYCHICRSPGWFDCCVPVIWSLLYIVGSITIGLIVFTIQTLNNINAIYQVTMYMLTELQCTIYFPIFSLDHC